MGTALQAMFEGAYAMLIEAFAHCAGPWQVEIGLLARVQWPAFEVARGLVEHAAIAADLHIAAGDQRQPQVVIRAVGAHAAVLRRVPPMLHIAFDKLVRGTHQQMLAGGGGRCMQHRQAVLQLVAKAKGAAGLVVAAARPEAAGDDLIHQPTIDQHVYGRIRGLHLHLAQGFLPMRAHRLQGAGGGADPAQALHQAGGGAGILLGAQAEDDFMAATIGQFEAGLDRPARVEPGANPPRQARLAHGCWCAQVAIAAEELAAVAADTASWPIDIEERHAAAILHRIGIASEQRTANWVRLGDHVHGGFFP